VAALIHWGRAHFTRGMYGVGPVRSAVLLVRFTSVMIVLHILQILLWPRSIAGIVFHRGNPHSTSRQPVIRRSGMEILFSRGCGDVGPGRKSPVC
jgi:hypothetical protein